MKIDSVDTFAIRIPGQAYMGGHGTDMNAGALGNYVPRYRSSYNLFTESLLVRVMTAWSDGGNRRAHSSPTLSDRSCASWWRRP